MPALPPAAGPASASARATATMIRGLTGWLAILVVFGAGGLIAGQQELAGMVALAGLFVAAQAADFERQWQMLYWALTWIVPVGGAAIFGGLAWMALSADLTGPWRMVVIGWSVAAGLVSLLTLARPFVDELVFLLFGDQPSTHSLRLATRLVLICLLLALPGYCLLPTLMDTAGRGSEGLLQDASLGGELMGYVILALAAVGFLIRRNLRSTLERLGLRPLRRRDLGVIAVGVGVIFAFNSAADWVQHRWFPALWDHDNSMNQLISKGLGVARILLLGTSAGIGEEITMRGALQPRLGLVMTSLVFAALHVQYSWFGMLVIAALGLILGVLRQRTSTTVSMAVHAIYDVLAVFAGK